MTTFQQFHAWHLSTVSTAAILRPPKRVAFGAGDTVTIQQIEPDQVGDRKPERTPR
jgi:hypothetical protein